MLLQSSALLLLFLDSCLETCFKKSKQKTMLKFQLKKLKKKKRERDYTQNKRLGGTGPIITLKW